MADAKLLNRDTRVGALLDAGMAVFEVLSPHWDPTGELRVRLSIGQGHLLNAEVLLTREQAMMLADEPRDVAGETT